MVLTRTWRSFICWPILTGGVEFAAGPKSQSDAGTRSPGDIELRSSWATLIVRSSARPRRAGGKRTTNLPFEPEEEVRVGRNSRRLTLTSAANAGCRLQCAMVGHRASLYALRFSLIVC